ncbi:LD-carboxypeptidase [Clostridium sp. SYSU_GA19001]|uniref:S66 peptidase family protein n=1 Tax=Clostridium caldaquaticum TaxID=2940653 RepID=UPI0020776FD7|nr:LD-carboxypeptidase [Clostridium caldaquaticum]
MIGKRLFKGDTIGIVAPAGIESIEKISIGIERLKKLGFKVKEGKNIYKKWGFFAGEDKERAQDIMDMFEDDKVDMILCVRGGYGSMRILPYLNFNKIRRNPKIFMGYSDITVLLNLFCKKEGLITFHGPMLTSDLDNEYTLKSFLFTVTKGFEPYIIENPAENPMISVSNKNAEGRIVGGNLTLICSTLGTPYEIDTKDKILFIEDVGEAPYRIDRMLTQLFLAGKLQQCSGFILGQFTDCKGEQKEDSFSLQQVIENRVISLNKPVLMNFMCGHDNPKYTLPVGAKAKLNCKNSSIEILQPVVAR